MSTQLIRSIQNIPAAAAGGVLTIGNFDGIHLGHQALVKKVVSHAKLARVPSVVMTFEPHAFEFFSRDNVTIPRITRLREKFCALAALGVDYVLIIPFNQKLASMPAADFIADVIVASLKPREIIIGDDFRFGYKRQGDFHLLAQAGVAHHFHVQAMPSFLINQERVSSTAVRKALMAGDQKRAEQLLGHPYCLLGRVCHGDQLGRRLGYPTANIHLHRKLTPVHGIYTVFMHGITDQPLPGVANVGERPTVDGTKTLLEVHLLDFYQDIYGAYVEVQFCEKLREEERYANLDLLTEQIGKDVALAKQYFKNQGVI